MDLSFSRRIILFPLTLHILILTSIQLQLINCIHICQTFLTTHWLIMVKLWIYIKIFILLLLGNSFHIVNFSIWLINWVFFPEKAISTFYKNKIPISFLCSSYQFSESLWKFFYNWTCFAQSTELFRKTFDLIIQIEEVIEPYWAKIFIYFTMNFWRMFFMDIAHNVFMVCFCKWVWQPCKTHLMSCNLPSHYWYKFLLLTCSPKHYSEFLENSCRCNIKIVSVIFVIFYLLKSLFTPWNVFSRKNHSILFLMISTTKKSHTIWLSLKNNFSN